MLTYVNAQRSLGSPAEPMCCDSNNQEVPPLCGRSCDNKFVFCLRDSKIESGTRDIATTCTYGFYATRSINNDAIMFSLGPMEFQLSPSNAQSTAPNPLTFSGNTWPVS